MTQATKPRTLSKDGSIHVTDEFYNTLISAVGAGLSLIGAFALVAFSLKTHKPWHVFAFLIYGAALVNLFVASALHHGVDGSEETENFLRELDYHAIFLMIAGTFTPFCLILLRNTLGWSSLGLIWVLALLGILLKVIFPGLPKWISTSMYLGMGWLGVVIAYPVYLQIATGVWFLILGGLFFTVGAVIFHFERPNPVPGRFGFHEIWHLFVLAGAASHFLTMYLYLLPF